MSAPRPTVFFEHREPQVHEDLSTRAGTDKSGGAVADVLLQRLGRPPVGDCAAGSTQGETCAWGSIWEHFITG